MGITGLHEFLKPACKKIDIRSPKFHKKTFALDAFSFIYKEKLRLK